MKKIQQLTILFFLGFIHNSIAQITAQQQANVDTVTNRLELKVLNDHTKFISDKKFAAGFDYVKLWIDGLGQVSDARASTNTYRWSDIGYVIGCVEFSPVEHHNRIIAMILSYTNPTSSYYKNAFLLSSIKNALNDNLILPLRQHPIYFAWEPDWFTTYFINKRSYAQCLLLLKGVISTTELMKYSDHISDGLDVKDKITSPDPHFDSEFQNAMWVGEVTMYKGAIENSFFLINKNCQSATSKINMKNISNPNTYDGSNEGIMRDYSIHEHGKQLYSGGYGLWFTNSYVDLLKLTSNTSFFTNNFPKTLPLFSEVLLNGYQWAAYRGTMDFGSVGRNISRPGSIYGISSSVLSYMMANVPSKLVEYQTWMNNRSYNGPSGVTGNRHFWQSDFMVHKGTNYYLSTKIPSVRTDGSESMNGENKKGYNLPLGAMNIYTRGSEYYNIYPLWDWSRIPGTTTEQNITYPGDHYFAATNDYGGAVSNKENGIMAFKGIYHSIATNKSYFYIGDAVLCLGAGITANKTNPIITSLNQTFTNGTITTSAGTLGTRNDYKWAHHDNVGYIFPTSQNINIQNVAQSGAWQDIGNYTDATTPKNVFSLWIDHGKTPMDFTYQYIIAPDKNLTAFQSFAGNHGFVVDKNDKMIQAVRNTLLKIYGVVFYVPGKITFPDGFSVEADKASIVLIDYSSGQYQISVSDPLYNKGSITKITFNKEFEGITTATNKSVMAVTTPNPDLNDMTVTSVKIVKLITGLQENEQHTISEETCYPNPYNTELYINATGAYLLYDIAGNLVEKGICEGGCSIGSSLSPGVYMLEFQNSVSKKRIKVMKQ